MSTDLLSLRAFTGDDAPLVIAGLFLVLVGLCMLVPSLVAAYKKAGPEKIDRLIAEALGPVDERPADLNIRHLGGRGTSANR